MSFFFGLVVGVIFGAVGLAVAAAAGLMIVIHRMAFHWMVDSLDDYLERIIEASAEPTPAPKKRTLS